MGEILMQSSSRNGADVIWLAVHTTEGIMRAADLLAWAGWPGSSHASSDETGALLTPADGFVPYDRAAWTLRNGNPISENIEQCGWAAWTRADWLARPLLLDATARWLADRSAARGIPLVHLTLADIKARKPGVIGHGDYTYATGDGTHTDPGANYPWDVVIDKARAYASGTPPEENDMDANQAKQLQETHDLLQVYLAPSIGRQEERQLQFRLEALAQIAGLQTALAELAKNSSLSAADLQAAVEAGTTKAIRDNVITVNVDVTPKPAPGGTS